MDAAHGQFIGDIVTLIVTTKRAAIA